MTILKLKKSQWISAGKKAGWMKTSDYIPIGSQSELKKEVTEFLKANDFSKLREWAKEKGHKEEDLNRIVDEMASGFVDFYAHGKANEKGVTPKDVNKEEFNKGKEIEKEHTNNEEIAERITLDHLGEKGKEKAKHSKYNTHLLNMEKKVEKNIEKKEEKKKE